MDEQPDDDRIFQKDSINQGDFVSGDKIERQVFQQQDPQPGARPVQPAQVQQPPQVVYVQQKGSSGFNALMWMIVIGVLLAAGLFFLCCFGGVVSAAAVAAVPAVSVASVVSIQVSSCSSPES